MNRRSTMDLDRGMHFPVGWDPYFQDDMTLRGVYHYPTQHYGHHRRQLAVAYAAGSDGPTAALLPAPSPGRRL